MEEVIIWTESEGVDAEEKNRAIEREFIGIKINKLELQTRHKSIMR